MPKSKNWLRCWVPTCAGKGFYLYKINGYEDDVIWTCDKHKLIEFVIQSTNNSIR